MDVARKGSPQEVFLSPIAESETSEDSGPPRTAGNETITLLRSPESKVFMPYESSSKAGDGNLRRIVYHCECPSHNSER